MVTWPPVTSLDKKPDLDSILDHFDYMVKVCGIEHVAWGSDMPEGGHETEEFWEATWGPNGLYPNVTGILGDWYTYENRLNSDFSTISRTPMIWDGMAKRGHSATDIEKITSGNWLRVMDEVWG